MEQQPPVTGVGAWARPWVVVPVFVLIAAAGGLFDSFTSSADLLVLGVGGVLSWIGLTGRAGRRPAPTALRRSTLWWLVPLLLLALVEVYTFAMNSIENYPTLSLLADPLLENYVARSATYFAWLLGFWGLIRR